MIEPKYLIGKIIKCYGDFWFVYEFVRYASSEHMILYYNIYDLKNNKIIEQFPFHHTEILELQKHGMAIGGGFIVIV